MNPDGSPGPNPLKIQVPIKKVRRVKTRGDGYKEIQRLGRGFANDTSQNPLLPQFAFSSAQKRDVLNPAADTLMRAVNAPNPTPAEIKAQKKKNDDAFDRLYRKAWDKQDELFSTASARSFIAGLLEKASTNQIDPRIWQRWMEIVDLISSLRIPTKFSGFSTSSGIMQHPTAAGEGYFAALPTASLHGQRDSQRVQYIGRALETSESAGQSLEQQLFAGMRAAIEFSLNYFTAPVTASNVKPFSTKAATLSDDASLQEQLEARESIKEIYLKVGGTLRNPSTADETPEQSWDRPWQQGIAIVKQDPFPVAPPSPRRTRRSTNPVQSSAAVALTAGGIIAAQTTPLPAPPGIHPFIPSPSHLAGPLSSSPFATMATGPSIPMANMTLLSPFAGPFALGAPSFLLAPPALLANDLFQGATQVMQSSRGAAQRDDPMELDAEDPLASDLGFDPGGSDPWEMQGEGFDYLDSLFAGISWTDILSQMPADIFQFSEGPFSSSSTAELQAGQSLDSGAQTLDANMFPSVPSDPPGFADMFPSVPSEPPGFADMFPSVPSEPPGLSDMFPSVPSEPPGLSEGASSSGAADEGLEALAAL